MNRLTSYIIFNSKLCLPVAIALSNQIIAHSIGNSGNNGASMIIRNKKVTFDYRNFKENDKN